MTAAKLTEIRREAVGTAASFFTEGEPPDIAELWRLAKFFEMFALGGWAATKEFVQGKLH